MVCSGMSCYVHVDIIYIYIQYETVVYWLLSGNPSRAHGHTCMCRIFSVSSSRTASCPFQDQGSAAPCLLQAAQEINDGHGAVFFSGETYDQMESNGIPLKNQTLRNHGLAGEAQTVNMVNPSSSLLLPSPSHHHFAGFPTWCGTINRPHLRWRCHSRPSARIQIRAVSPTRNIWV